MHKRRIVGRLILISLLTAAATQSAGADVAKPIVVELFTSQGCSSCPPANENLIRIGNQQNVLVLSFSVTYWDYLGWKDTYGKPEFTNRQIAYEPPLKQAGPYTPQMVINGTATVVGNNLRELKALLAATAPLSGPALILKEDHVEIASGGQDTADVWVVRYDPNIDAVPVGRGENIGATLKHIHVVRSLQKLGVWDGSQASFSLPSREQGLRTAVLLQRPEGGPILAAVSD